ncbi:hypothetical protein BXZ70DRAFT_908009 [Cristinia sonorae]|uniref:Uncharacterized protein n=1 Tax=Cristinia sonorae TaxID=1940300 RepID=A0A8K0XP10_9AGAR|nr:hypothetical protein BXZ70DRAFT_908009 [Cristinia sonorae]
MKFKSLFGFLHFRSKFMSQATSPQDTTSPNNAPLNFTFPFHEDRGDVVSYFNQLLTYYKGGGHDIWNAPVVLINHYKNTTAVQHEYCAVGYKVKDSSDPNKIHYVRIERGTDISQRPVAGAQLDPEVRDVPQVAEALKTVQDVATEVERENEHKPEDPTTNPPVTAPPPKPSSTPSHTLLQKLFHKSSKKPKPRLARAKSDDGLYETHTPRTTQSTTSLASSVSSVASSMSAFTQWKSDDRVFRLKGGLPTDQPDTKCVTSLSLADNQLTLLHVAMFAATIHLFESVYSVFRHQCYWFAALLVAIAREWTKTKVKEVNGHLAPTTELIMYPGLTPGTYMSIPIIRLTKAMVAQVFSLSKGRWTMVETVIRSAVPLEGAIEVADRRVEEAERRADEERREKELERERRIALEKELEQYKLASSSAVAA